jgi:protein gp37
MIAFDPHQDLGPRTAAGVAHGTLRWRPTMSLHPTTIPWCTYAANWQAGCSHASPGCDHCWAETTTARRLAPNPQAPARYHRGVTEGDSWTGRIEWDPQDLRDALNQLARMQRPCRIFLGDMTDLFHPQTPAEALEKFADYLGILTARWAPVQRHTFVLCTKRPEQLLAWQQEYFPAGLPDQVWALASVCCQGDADRMIPALLQVRGKVRGVSCEPLLGPVDLAPYLLSSDGFAATPDGPVHVDDGGSGLSWVIVGGESGPKARPMHPTWARGLRDQCEVLGTAVYFKSWGAWSPVKWSCCVDHERGLVTLGDDHRYPRRRMHEFPDGQLMARLVPGDFGDRLDDAKMRDNLDGRELREVPHA